MSKNRILLFLLSLALLSLLFLSQVYRLKPKTKAPDAVIKALNDLAMQALNAREVPVGAVLVYKDSIIGRGFNTVLQDTLLSGHAEINALNEAHRKYRPLWKTLDRSKMTLYSTYEPCEMCKGAMLNLNISYAVFEGPKPLSERLKTTLKNWGYELHKTRLDAPEMQENLFKQHPDYNQ